MLSTKMRRYMDVFIIASIVNFSFLLLFSPKERIFWFFVSGGNNTWFQEQEKEGRERREKEGVGRREKEGEGRKEREGRRGKEGERRKEREGMRE